MGPCTDFVNEYGFKNFLYMCISLLSYFQENIISYMLSGVDGHSEIVKVAKLDVSEAEERDKE